MKKSGLRLRNTSVAVSLSTTLMLVVAGCSTSQVAEPETNAKSDTTAESSSERGADSATDLGAGLASNAESTPATVPAASSMPKMAMPASGDIVFKDDVESNVELPVGLDGLVFFDTRRKRVALKDFLGKKNVVLVFTEGFAGGMLCPFCKTQTSRLVANYDKFAKLDTEILVVYPGTRQHLGEFVKAAKTTEKAEVDSIPFPLVLDEDLSAVGYFNIASNLAHPSTFIIDKSGNVRLAYVGADMSADRPSVNAMLGVLKDANGL